MVITVSDGQSIQAAVHAAAPGDTIHIEPGVFREAVRIGPGKDGLRIIGAGAGQTILDGTGIRDHAGITLDGASRVSVAGLTVRSFAGDGILLKGDGCVLRRCEITQCNGAGIVMDGCGNVVYETLIHGNGRHGLHLSAGCDNRIIANRSLANGDRGVLVEAKACRTLLLENEAAVNDGHGIEVCGEAGRLIGNRTNNNGGTGLVIQDGRSMLLYGNSSTENRGDGLLLDVADVALIQNQLGRNRGDGIGVASEVVRFGLLEALVHASEMHDNLASGIRGAGPVSRLLMFECNVDGNGANGLDLDMAEGARVLESTAHRNGGSGLRLGGRSSNNVVDGNSVRDNRRGGIEVAEGSSANVLRQNEIRKNAPFDLPDAALTAGSILDGNRQEGSVPVEAGGESYA